MSETVFTYDHLAWRDLSERDRGAWAAFRAARDGLRSPYFDLGWGDAVAAARGDLKVLRALRRGRAVAYLAYHPGPFGAARPAGANFGDWHGFVAEPDIALNVADALSGGPAAFTFAAAPEDDPGFAAVAETQGGSYGVDLSQGFELYARPVDRAAPKAVANFRRAMRKLEADGLEPAFRLDDPDPAVLETLLALKSAQYRRSGHADALSWLWSRRLIEALLGRSTHDFGVRLSSLRFGGELAAVHLGLRSGARMHHWLPAYDPRFQKYAPGNLLTHEIAREGAASGLVEEIDFGPGDYTWKAEFANRRNPYVGGVAHAASLEGRSTAAARAVGQRWSRLPVGPAAGLPARAWRRLERTLAPYAPPPAEPSAAGAPT